MHVYASGKLTTRPFDAGTMMGLACGCIHLDGCRQRSKWLLAWSRLQFSMLMPRMHVLQITGGVLFLAFGVHALYEGMYDTS